MVQLTTPQPARHPSPTVKARKLAYLVFERPDLDKAERFLTDFGLHVALRSTQEVYLRAADASPFCYLVRRAERERFVGFGLEVAAREDLLALAKLPGRGLTAVADRSEKRAEQTAAAILREIALAGWPIGEVLGSEAELMERYDVSRAVLREAVRVLEHHQVAEMRRGPGGGLFVTQPGVGAIADAVALQVDRLGLTGEDLFEVRTAVERAVLDAVLARGDGPEVRDRLQAALDAEAGATPAELAVLGHDLHEVLATVSGNRVLELVVLVLLRLTRAHLPPADPTQADEGVSDHVRSVHRKLVEAVLAGDAELARARLDRHLQSMVPFAYLD